MFSLQKIFTIKRIFISVLHFLFFLILFFVFYKTGLHGDDFTVINEFKKNGLNYFLSVDLINKSQNIFAISSHYLYFWLYYVLADNFQIIYDLAKYLIHIAMIYFVYKFLSDYFPKNKAFFGSSIFIFFPTHDSTIFWLMTILHILGPCVLMYLHHLIKNDKFLPAFFLLPACFISYSTPPFIFGLSLIFIFEKNYKKFFLFFLPCSLYVVFYLCISFITNIVFTNNFGLVERRIDYNLDIITFIKNFILQNIALIESFFGPSFFIKIYLCYKEHSFISLILCFFFYFLSLSLELNKQS